MTSASLNMGLVEGCLLIAFHDELVGAADELDVVLSVELLDDVASEEVAGAAGGEVPALDVWVREGYLRGRTT